MKGKQVDKKKKKKLHDAKKKEYHLKLKARRKLENGYDNSVKNQQKENTRKTRSILSSVQRNSHNHSTKQFFIGSPVLARWDDDLFYMGKVIKVGARGDKCFIRFEDDSAHWVANKNIREAPGEIPDIASCCVCLQQHSQVTDEIYCCDTCGLCYHQNCHNPNIIKKKLSAGKPWQCCNCTSPTKSEPPQLNALSASPQKLPYNLKSLTWDDVHKRNQERKYCYCGNPGDWYMKMLQCNRCQQWFHEGCLECINVPLLAGDRFYVFLCSICNYGREFLRRLDITWTALVHLIIFNMTMEEGTKYWDMEEDIIPWMNNHWSRLQVTEIMKALPRTKREFKVREALHTSPDTFQCGKENRKRNTLWGLRKRLPPSPPVVVLPNSGCIDQDTAIYLLNKGTKRRPASPNNYEVSQKRKSNSDAADAILKKAKKLKLMKTPEKKWPATIGKVGFNGLPINQGYLGYKSSLNKVLSPGKVPDSPQLKQRLLETNIPWPSSYEGYNHPFKTVLEAKQELTVNQTRVQILNRFHNESQDAESDALTENTDSERPLTPVPIKESNSLSKVLTEKTKENKLIEEDLPKEQEPSTPNSSYSNFKNNPLRKKRGRKSKAELAAIAMEQNKNMPHVSELEQRLKRKRKLPAHAQNVVDKSMLDGMRKKEVSMSKLKSSVATYFGAVDRLVNGEAFRVTSRRVTADGKVQYLVEWQGSQ